MRNFINEWKPALFNTLVYGLFITSLFYLTLGQMLWLVVFGMVCTTLGNSVLLHRYYTHRHFKLSKLVEYMLLPFALIIGIGSPIMYVTMHRQHHRVCDEQGDPHSPSKLGLATVVTGLWEFFPASYFAGLNAPMPKDMLVKPLQRFIHVNYYTIWIVSLLVVSVVNWHVAVAVFAWAAVFQKVFENIIVNGICHPSKDVIKDWPVFGIITGGESMQYFHHKYPNTVKYTDNWLVDPAYPIIKVISNDTIS